MFFLFVSEELNKNLVKIEKCEIILYNCNK